MNKKRFLVERCEFVDMSVIPVESFDFDNPELAVRKYLDFCKTGNPSMVCIEAKTKADADVLLGYVYINWAKELGAEICRFYNANWFYRILNEQLNGTSKSPFTETGGYEMIEPFSVG